MNGAITRGCFCAMLLTIVPLGCGGSAEVAGDESEIGNLVADVSDASFDGDRFSALFVTGQVPKDSERERYRVFMYRTKSLEVTGEMANAMVEIEHGTSGEIRGEFQWTFQRDAGGWKVVSAPIPAN